MAETTSDDTARAEQMARFCEIVRHGGEIVCAPDTHRRLLDALQAAGITPTHTTIRVSHLLPRGHMAAVQLRRISPLLPAPHHDD